MCEPPRASRGGEREPARTAPPQREPELGSSPLCTLLRGEMASEQKRLKLASAALAPAPFPR